MPASPPYGAVGAPRTRASSPWDLHHPAAGRSPGGRAEVGVVLSERPQPADHSPRPSAIPVHHHPERHLVLTPAAMPAVRCHAGALSMPRKWLQLLLHRVVNSPLQHPCCRHFLVYRDGRQGGISCLVCQASLLACTQ